MYKQRNKVYSAKNTWEVLQKNDVQKLKYKTIQRGENPMLPLLSILLKVGGKFYLNIEELFPFFQFLLFFVAFTL